LLRAVAAKMAAQRMLMVRFMMFLFLFLFFFFLTN